MAMTGIDALLCSLLREGGQWSGDVPAPADAERLIDVARRHGVLSLVDDCLAGLPGRNAWPAAIVARCHDAAIAGVVGEALQREELVRVLEAFAGAGIRPLLLKGGALAYSHYRQPYLRPRCDSDLLVPESSAAAAGDVLAGLGYARNHGISGTLIAYQSSWTCRDRWGAEHHVDLHWRVNNAQALAKALEYGELAAHAVPVEALGPFARTPSPRYALLFACLHRAGHMGDAHHSGLADHPGGDRLIWLYDIHLLFTRMSAEEREEFLSLATAKRMKAICRDALSRCASCFGTAIPASVLDRLEPAGPAEPTAILLHREPALRMLGDLAALGGLQARARWLRELVFPSPGYMRAKYEGAAFAWLPWLYLRRAAHGLWKVAIPRHRAP